MDFKLSGAQTPLLTSGLPFSLSFTVSARVHGPLTLAGLQNALERQRLRHPLLGVRLAAGGAGTAPCFTTDGVPPIPLRVVERTGDQDWVGEVEREVPQPGNYRTGPLFRCVWLRGSDVSDLLLVCDHITADGRAGMYALRDLLELLARPDLLPEPLPPTPLAELLPPSTLARIAELASADTGPARLAPTREQEVPPAGPMRILPFSLEESETSALVKRCRAEGVTVQAALCAAFAMPFAERQPDVPVRLVECPVDIRSRLVRSPGETYGNYISLALIRMDCRPGRNPWEVAREAGCGLAAVTDEQLFTNPLVMTNVSERPISTPLMDICYDLSISNLGRVDIPEQYGPFQLESIYAPTLNVCLPGHRILGVTTFAGRMRCTFASCDPEIPQLLRRACEILAAMLRP